MDTDSAGCCGASGSHVVCHPLLADGTCDTTQEDPATAVGRFIAVPQTMTQADARTYCQTHYVDLASIHSPSEQAHALSACTAYADGACDQSAADCAFGCWIGLYVDARSIACCLGVF